jgi:hypothetical protein
VESSPARACPSCSAPAAAHQRWCLECGAELGPSRRAGLGSAVGIATTLAVLVGAASAGGYTLLQDGKRPPPAPTTVAQAPPTVTAIPPATQEPAPYLPPPAPVTGVGGTVGTITSGGTTTTGTSATRASGGTNAGGAGVGERRSRTRAGDVDPEEIGGAPPRLIPTNVALGSTSVPYAPYATDDVDLGDALRAVDGTTRTAWRTPPFADPAASPQLGLYVELAQRERLRRLVIRTPTPGIDVEIYAARKGPPATIVEEGWDHLADRDRIERKTTVKLPDRPYRYVLVWIVGLPPEGTRAAISEIELISLQPE